MRKLWYAAGITLALLLVLFVLPFFIDINKYHDKVQAELETLLHRKVSVGQMHLGILPPAIRVDHVDIAEDPAFATGHAFAVADSVSLRLKFMPLLTGNLEIAALELKRPQIELAKNAEGVWNFSSLGKVPAPAAPANPNPDTAPTAPATTPAQQPQTSSAQANLSRIALDHVAITDGEIAITDDQAHQPRSVYQHIDIALGDVALSKKMQFDVAVHLPGQGDPSAKLQGDAGPVNLDKILDTPFSGKLTLDKVPLSAVQQYAHADALNDMEATVSGTTELQNLKGQIASKGDLSIEQSRIHGTDIGYPIKAVYDVSYDLAPNIAHIKNAQVNLGSTPLAVSGSVNLGGTPTQLDIQVSAKNAELAEAARLASAFGIAFNPGVRVTGRLSADVHAQGPLPLPALNGTVSAVDLVATGNQLPQPVKVGAIELTMTPEAIQSNDFTASTSNTSVNVRAAVMQYAGDDPQINATVRANHADIANIIDIARTFGVTAVEGIKGSGTLSLDVNADGPAKRPADLHFGGTAAIQNASVSTPYVTQPIRIQNANMHFTQNSASIDGLTASLGHTTANGTMTVRNFVSPDVTFNLAADTVNVVELQAMLAPGPAPAKRARADFFQLVPTAEAAKVTAESTILNRTTGSGTLSINKIVNDQIVLNHARSTVKLDHGIVKLAPLTAEMFGGTQTGSITTDMRSVPISYSVSSSFQKVDANQLLSSVSSIKQMLFGILAANAQTSFSGTGPDSIAQSLNGNLSVNMADGKIMAVDLVYELAALMQSLRTGQQKKSFTKIVKMTGDMKLTNGLAETNNLKIALEDASLAAEGGINLVDQSVNLHLVATFSKAISQQITGNKVGNSINVALSNRNGELVIPVVITGTMQKYKFAPDLRKLADIKLQMFAPGLDTKKIASFFKGKGKQADAKASLADETPDKKKGGGVKGFFGKLFKGDKKKDAPEPK
ncbi:MAG: hypothetical protein JWO13_3058 [Acidobacteriales bacterium]|nr:hypothetical protein [Terriglobales bacterium]